jgi:hypothetical protein
MSADATPGVAHRSRPKWLRVAAGFLACVASVVRPYDITRTNTWLNGLWLVLIVLVAMLLLPLISYRRRDCLMLFIPFYNLVVLSRLGYRLSNLPVRDWPPRPDEPGYVRWHAARAAQQPD